MAEQKCKHEVDENGKTVGAMVAKPKFDPKDPLRPRRKKARRACYACQRAHLTCGDERPCQRCIKRGLADVCQDGIRKKAKYVHDAPSEALRPVLGLSFNQINNRSVNVPLTASSMSEASPSMMTYFTQADASPSYSIYSTQMAPPLQAGLSYRDRASSISPGFQTPGPDQTEVRALPLPPQTSVIQNAFSGATFDPNNPGLFAYDLGDLQFDNQYGAMEFSMLAHMSSAASATTPGNSGTMPPPHVGYNYSSGPTFGTGSRQYGQMYQQQIMPDYLTMNPQSAGLYLNSMNHGTTQAYSIGTASLTSPSTDGSPTASGMGFDSPPAGSYTRIQSATHRPNKAHESNESHSTKSASASVLGKRSRDSSSVYDTVHEPYSYTAGFHGLTACLQRRFTPAKTLRIAKSLASIRPSFILCTKSLTRKDLIFMEKCFQRTLFEYDDFMVHCCTPTLVCRRTGEVAAVNKEFTLLTGWKKDVLLGYQPNLNINIGKNNEERQPAETSETSQAPRGALSTPRKRPLVPMDAQAKEGKLQPVFLAELLDDDSVIEFYENFAKLAFGDSRGSVNSRCKLLKYQTRETTEAERRPLLSSSLVKIEDIDRPTEVPYGPMGLGMGMDKRLKGIEDEYGIRKLEKDGKIDCSYCWTVKRDCFNIPMLIVMNFLPCI